MMVDDDEEKVVIRANELVSVQTTVYTFRDLGEYIEVVMACGDKIRIPHDDISNFCHKLLVFRNRGWTNE